MKRLHLVEADKNLLASALSTNVGLIVEGIDAGIEAYADDGEGSWGSYVSLGVINAATGVLVDKWGIIRQTSAAGDGSLRFTWGTGANPAFSAAKMTIQSGGNLGIALTHAEHKLEQHTGLGVTPRARDKGMREAKS